MGRNFAILVSIVSGLCLFGSCVTDVVSENGSGSYADDDFAGMSVPFRVAISSDNDEWAESSQNKEGEIFDLKIIFFKETGDDAVVTGIEDVQPTYNGNIYEGEYKLGPEEESPDFAVGIANYSGDCKFLTFQEMLNTVTSTPVTPDGYILMSSMVSFDENKAVCKTSRLSPVNFKNENPEPIEIYLDRGVAKVTVGENEELYHPAVNWIYKDKKVYVTTKITGWEISGTDRETYLVKNLEGKTREDIESELNPGGDKTIGWYEEVSSEIGFGRIHWAHSVNWEKSNYPAQGKENEDDDLDFSKYEEIRNSLFESESNPGSIYVAESTRKSNVFGKQNALPKIVVAARHSLSVSESSLDGDIGDGIAGENSTFYLCRIADDSYEVMLEEDYWNRIADSQRAILKESSDERPDAGELQKILEERIVAEDGWNLVRPAIKDDAELSGYVTSEGKEITEENMAALNEILYQSCGIVEKYFEGKAVYSAPIVHFSENLDGETSTTGAYGLVRNNHYLININSISGPGAGIPADDVIVGDLSQSFLQLGFRVSRIPWTEVSQEAEFGK